MTKYELRKATYEASGYRRKKLSEIHEGCTLDWSIEDGVDDATTIATFDNAEDALKALSAYESDVRVTHYNGEIIDITEYFVESSEYDDEDGEWTGVFDYLAFSAMPELCEDEEEDDDED